MHDHTRVDRIPRRRNTSVPAAVAPSARPESKSSMAIHGRASFCAARVMPLSPPYQADSFGTARC
jgi:hypothetical protein